MQVLQRDNKKSESEPMQVLRQNQGKSENDSDSGDDLGDGADDTVFSIHGALRATVESSSKKNGIKSVGCMSRDEEKPKQPAEKCCGPLFRCNLDYMQAHLADIPYALDPRNNTVLDYALDGGKDNCAEFLLRQKQILCTLQRHRADDGGYHLIYAIKNNNVGLVRQMLDKHNIKILVPNNAPGELVCSALHESLYLVEKNGPAMFKTLLLHLFIAGKYTLMEIYKILHFQQYCDTHQRGHHLLEVAESLGDGTHMKEAKRCLDKSMTMLREMLENKLHH